MPPGLYPGEGGAGCGVVRTWERGGPTGQARVFVGIMRICSNRQDWLTRSHVRRPPAAHMGARQLGVTEVRKTRSQAGKWGVAVGGPRLPCATRSRSPSGRAYFPQPHGADAFLRSQSRTPHRVTVRPTGAHPRASMNRALAGRWGHLPHSPPATRRSQRRSRAGTGPISARRARYLKAIVDDAHAPAAEAAAVAARPEPSGRDGLDRVRRDLRAVRRALAGLREPVERPRQGASTLGG